MAEMTGVPTTWEATARESNGQVTAIVWCQWFVPNARLNQLQQVDQIQAAHTAVTRFISLVIKNRFTICKPIF